jgi:hypothetical protein
MTGNREEGARLVIEVKKAVVGTEHREVIPHEEAPDAAREKIYIPEAVDFRLPGRAPHHVAAT